MVLHTIFFCVGKTAPIIPKQQTSKKAGTSRQKVDPNLQAEDSWRFQTTGALLEAVGKDGQTKKNGSSNDTG